MALCCEEAEWRGEGPDYPAVHFDASGPPFKLSHLFIFHQSFVHSTWFCLTKHQASTGIHCALADRGYSLVYPRAPPEPTSSLKNGPVINSSCELWVGSLPCPGPGWPAIPHHHCLWSRSCTIATVLYVFSGSLISFSRFLPFLYITNTIQFCLACCISVPCCVCLLRSATAAICNSSTVF